MIKLIYKGLLFFALFIVIFLFSLIIVKADCNGLEDYDGNGRIDGRDYLIHKRYIRASCSRGEGEGEGRPNNIVYPLITRPSSSPFILENDGSRTYLIDDNIINYKPNKLIIKWKPETRGLYYFTHNNIDYKIIIFRNGINIKVLK